MAEKRLYAEVNAEGTILLMKRRMYPEETRAKADAKPNETYHLPYVEASHPAHNPGVHRLKETHNILADRVEEVWVLEERKPQDPVKIAKIHAERELEAEMREKLAEANTEAEVRAVRDNMKADVRKVAKSVRAK